MATTPRQLRERELVAATRALFDERGMQDAPVEEIARAVGIARGLIYRHFSSKEELYVLTTTHYLAELEGELDRAVEDCPDPVECARRLLRAYAGFCRRYPAFLDCSLSLMKRPARELRAAVSESVWLRLGQGMAACVDHVSGALRRDKEDGVLEVGDPDFAATMLWTQTLGAMHLARLGVGVRQAAPGIPELFPVPDDEIVEFCVRSALATVGVRPG